MEACIQMDAGTVINIARQTIWVIVETAVPVLLVSMVVGLVISLFQTLTSIQEQTLTFVPKLIAILLTIMIIGSWMLNQITGFMNNLWNFSQYEVALGQFELFVLILIRLASFVFAAPFFNTANVPNRFKIGFSFALSIIVYSINSDMTVQYNNMMDFCIIVVQEVIVGILLGAVSSFAVQIIQFSGKMIDMDIGISMAQIYDPTTRMQVGIMGNFYYYMLMLLLIISGMHRFLIEAIVETYNVIPIGGVKFGAGLYTTIIQFMSDYFVIGFRIALPVFATMLLLNCILAILARIAPQMNMFVVGMQLKIFVGIFVIFFTIRMLPAVSNFIFEEIKDLFSLLVRGMS